MENWKRDERRDVVVVDLEALVPADHLLVILNLLSKASDRKLCRE